ncbi:MAG: toxin-antitoxin system HicB family antitoxin [Gaiellaceae bacterium]
MTPSGPGPEKAASQQDRTLEQYLALPYHVALVRDGDGEGGPWVAQVEELAGCTSRAETAELAASGIQQAMSDWIREALHEGREVPKPKPVDEHSGRLLLRMPRTLHAELTRVAEREAVSLNQFITDALASAVGWRLARSAGREPTRSLNQVPGAEALTHEQEAEPESEERRSRRLLITLLGVNVVVLAIAAVVAAIVLIVALR